MKHIKFRGVPQQSVAVVTVEQFQKLDEKITKILETLDSGVKKSTHAILNEYMKKCDAMEILDKKATWMWEKEKEGVLRPYKIGKRSTFYKVQDIIDLIENSKTTGSCQE